MEMKYLYVAQMHSQKHKFRSSCFPLADYEDCVLVKIVVAFRKVAVCFTGHLKKEQMRS